MNKRITGSVERDTNRFGSHPNHENLTLRRTPASGPLRGTVGREIFIFYSPIHCSGAPYEEAAIIVTDGKIGNNPHIISEYYDFPGKSSIKKLNAHGGFTPAAVTPPNVIASR